MIDISKATLALHFNLNGQPFVARVPENASLLEVLREECGIISVKNGCAPQGQCGCCTVLVEGKATLSCVFPAMRVAGKAVMTLEGLPEAERAAIAEAFACTGGLQCGFCTPGIAVRTKHILNRNPNPSRQEIARALRPHLCRCTGYKKIIDAVDLAARALRGEPPAEIDESGRVGSNLPKYGALELALGQRPFVDDLQVPGMLYGALLFSPAPRFRIDRLDTSKGLILPGVAAVYTAADVPGDRYRGLIYKDWPLFIAPGETTRYIGDVLAAVVADDPRTARQALALIEVSGEALTPITGPDEALAPDAPLIHPGGNLLSRSIIKRGDPVEAFRTAAHVASGVWSTQFIEHAYLEPESCVAAPEGDGLRVWSQSQGVFDDQRQIAEILDLARERVRVTLIANGGAFGGKEDLLIQGHAALLAWRLSQPVKITLTREESIRMHPKRHPVRMEYTLACNAEGRLTALRARLIGDKGAYSSVGSKVLERAAGHAGGPYRIPNLDIEALAVYTNNPPCGAMRGFGANQAAFALEGALDMLAEQAGIDRWDIRYLNALENGDVYISGQVLEGGVGIKKTLLAVKDTYQAARYAGIACAIKNTGLGNGMPDIGRATLIVEPDGSVTICHGFTEMGQGLYTVSIQTACEETGLPPSVFRVAATDTIHPNDCGMTTASRGTFLACHAVREAAIQLKADLESGKKLEDLAGRHYQGEKVFDYTTQLGTPVEKPVTHVAFSYATQVVILDDEGRLQKVVAAHDVGKAINPRLCEAQIEGSIHMGLGYALTEELRVVDGAPQNTTMRSLGLLLAQDMPEIEVILVEEPDPAGPYGAKGIGEIALVPTAPTVQSALHAFDGVRRFSLPMKDSPAARTIKSARYPGSPD